MRGLMGEILMVVREVKLAERFKNRVQALNLAAQDFDAMLTPLVDEER